MLDLIKTEGVVAGAKARNKLTGEEFVIKARSVINATGPFTDSIRKMDDGKSRDIVCPSAGVHIVLPDYYSPVSMGLLDPATSDGRVIFFLVNREIVNTFSHFLFISAVGRSHHRRND